ncbi:MAG TPA: lipase maturation factor family protein, partial [Acidobacteriota bacterium]
NPWLIHLLYKLLKNDPLAIGLLKRNPFSNAPPRYIRADLYEYRFTKDRSGGAWWQRKKVGSFLRPLSADDPELKRYIESHGW